MLSVFLGFFCVCVCYEVCIQNYCKLFFLSYLYDIANEIKKLKYQEIPYLQITRRCAYLIVFFGAALIQGRRLFRGGAYSGAALINGHSILIARSKYKKEKR